MTLTEISPFLPIETASVSLVIDRLQKRKLIQRRHSRTDRRNIFITLTPQGKEMVDTLWPPIFNLVMDMFYKNLTDEERQLFMSILRKIRDANISQP
jgi:MarR family 2-MHQ and catechol resistance regulon transcriptional repressor